MKKTIHNSFLDFAKKYSSLCRKAEQTVIYAVIDNHLIYNLPKKFNYRIAYNEKKEVLKSKTIFHFYGQPKHWSLFAEFIHPHYFIFKRYLNKTYYKSYKNISIKSFKNLLVFFHSCYLKTSTYDW